MAWVESHQSLSRHSKTLDVAEMLSVHRHEVIGLLMDLWWWALDNVPSNGYMGHISNARIAVAACWDGDQNSFSDALIKAGFIDEREDGRWLHDWYDYAGKLLEKREKDAERKRQSRENPTDVQRTSSGQDVDSPQTVERMSERTVPNRTVPNKDNIPFDEIVACLNGLTGKSFKASSSATQRLIRARWNEGYRLDDFKLVISNRVKAWSDNPDMVEYLRPSTLFSPKFESYFNSIPKSDKLEPPKEKVMTPEEEEDERLMTERLMIAYAARANSAPN